MKIARLVPLLALLAALAPDARASKAFDCRHYDRGTEILSDITERYYGGTFGEGVAKPAEEGGHKVWLHASVLYYEKADAEALIATANLTGKGKSCAAVDSARTNLVKELQAVVNGVKASKTACLTYPKSESELPACASKAKVFYDADRKVAKQGGTLDAFVAAVRANPDCSPLQFTDERMDADTMEGVYKRFKKEMCYRDDRCEVVRVGKMREAREELARIEQPGKDPAPGELTGAHMSVKPLLFAQKGEATDESSADNGAENILWHLSLWNGYYEHPDAFDNSWLLFVATQKVATAHLILKKQLPVCDGSL